MPKLIDRTFPDCERVKENHPLIIPEWNAILRAPRLEALHSIANHMSMPTTSRFRGLIVNATDYCVMRPLKKRYANKPEMFQLVIQLNEAVVISFAMPVADRLRCSLDIPAEFKKLVTHLGALRFDRLAGLIWPSQIEATKCDLGFHDTNNGLIPFFSHGTGDYDCWSEDDFQEIWSWNHETRRKKILTTGGFTAWLDVVTARSISPSNE